MHENAWLFYLLQKKIRDSTKNPGNTQSVDEVIYCLAAFINLKGADCPLIRI